MQRSSAVSWTVTPSRWHLRLVLTGCLAVAALGAGFAYDSASSLSAKLLPGGATLACCAMAWNGWRQAPSGTLRWDGQQWHWSGFRAAQACTLQWHMDLQHTVLVCVRQPAQGSVWLWLERRSCAPDWMALRRALVSNRKPRGEPGNLPSDERA